MPTQNHPVAAMACSLCPSAFPCLHDLVSIPPLSIPFKPSEDLMVVLQDPRQSGLEWELAGVQEGC